MASDCAARGGSTGLHSGLRTGRVAGLLCRPWAGRHVHGCRVVGAVPGRQRHGEIAAVGRARCGPGGPAEARSAGRSPDCHAGQVCCAGRKPRERAGRRTGPARVSGVPSHPRARALGPCQSVRRWGTDGPAANTSRSSRVREPGPDDSDHATAEAAGREPGAGGAAGGRPGAGGPASQIGP